MTKLSENSIYTYNIHFVNADSKDARSIKEFVRSYNSDFSFNIVVRNKIWKTSNKTLVILDVAGFDMVNKQKFIERLLNFDIDTIQPMEKKDKESDHHYSS